MKSDSTLVERLEQVLKDERKALLSANIDGIEGSGSLKVKILEQISSDPTVDLSKFEHLKGRLAQNQALAQSAVAGMRSAIMRANDINDVASGLRTYSANGQTDRVAVKSGQNLSKRS